MMVELAASERCWRKMVGDVAIMVDERHSEDGCRVLAGVVS